MTISAIPRSGFSSDASSVDDNLRRHRESRQAAAAGRGITTEKMLVTPAIAEEWLALNHGNRNVTAPRVDLFVRLIREEKFCLTHQGVAFYDDGDLADGQTRLTAIAKAGVSVWMFVTRGLPRAAIHAIDGGRPRTVRDVLHFLGMPLTASHVAVVRTLWNQYHLQRREDCRVWDNNSVDTDTFANFAAAVGDAVVFSMPSTKKKGLSHASYIGAIASAWFTQNREMLLRMKQLVDSGVGADRDEQAAIRLRDWLLTTHISASGAQGRQEIYKRSCTAIRAFLEGRPLAKLYCREDAAFQIPDLIRSKPSR